MANGGRRTERLTLSGFAVRFIAATVLVLGTYNPSGYSFAEWIHASWLHGGFGSIGAPHYFVGVVLLIGWLILLRATFNSLGAIGLVLGAALLGTLTWLLYDWGILTGSSVSFYAWIAEVSLGALLAIGLCWSLIWRQLTGQVEVDRVDN